MDDHYQDQTFYINILNKAQNTISRHKTFITKYDHRMTQDIPMEFDFEDDNQIIIGVTDDRQIFDKDHNGKYCVI